MGSWLGVRLGVAALPGTENRTDNKSQNTTMARVNHFLRLTGTNEGLSRDRGTELDRMSAIILLGIAPFVGH